MIPTRRTGLLEARSRDRLGGSITKNSTAADQHERGVRDGIQRFWHDYEIRNSGRTDRERIAELEHIVNELIYAHNANVAWINEQTAAVR